MSEDNKYKEMMKALEEFQELQKTQLAAVLNKTDSIFTPEQAIIVKDLLSITYNLTRTSEEFSNAYVNLITTLETFYEILVEDLGLFSKEKFEEIAQRILFEKTQKLEEIKNEKGST